MNYFFLSHFAVDRGFWFLNHPLQGVVLFPNLIDFINQFVSNRSDEVFGVGLDHVHLSSNGIILLLEFSQGFVSPVDVIFVAVALWDEGDITVLGEIRIHNGYNMNINQL